MTLELSFDEQVGVEEGISGRGTTCVEAQRRETGGFTGELHVVYVWSRY